MTDLRALALAATPGPWRQSRGTVIWAPLTDDPTDWSGLAVAYAVESEMHPKGARQANAAFIAASSPAVVLALLDCRDMLSDAAVTVHYVANHRFGFQMCENPTCVQYRAALARVEEVTE